MNEFVRRPSRRRDPKAYVPVTHSIKLSITSPRGSAVSYTLEGTPPGRSAGIGRSHRNPGLTVDQCPMITLQPTPSSSPSLTPSPSPRTKSPLLKQQAIVDEALSRVALPAAFRRSDFSDSGVENPSAGSPKTSQSSDQSWLSTDSGIPMDTYGGGVAARARRCPRLGSSPVNTQGTESVSDMSDLEAETDAGDARTTGVIFRKVTLKKKKKANPVIVTHELENDFDDTENRAATFPSSSPPLVIPLAPTNSSSSSQTLPNNLANSAWSFWNQVGSSFSFPRSKETRSVAIKLLPHHGQNFGGSEAQCSPGSSLVAHSDSNDSLWWDHGSSPPTPARVRKANKGGGGVSGNGGGCWWSRSASWDDLSTISVHEDRDQSQNPEDLLSTVADKIVPEGDEYRLVFISSSSSKSSGLDIDDCASRNATPDARRMDSATNSGSDADDGQGPSPTFSLEEVEMADHVRELVTRSVSDSSESTSPGTEVPVTLRDSVSVYVRGNSVRSSGERSLEEMSSWDHVVPFHDPERVVLHPRIGADVVTISVDCFSGVGSSGLLVGDVNVGPVQRSIVKVDDDFDDLQYLFLEADEVPQKEAPKEPPPPIPTLVDDDEDDDDFCDDGNGDTDQVVSSAKSAKELPSNEISDATAKDCVQLYGFESRSVLHVEAEDSVNVVLLEHSVSELEQHSEVVLCSKSTEDTSESDGNEGTVSGVPCVPLFFDSCEEVNATSGMEHDSENETDVANLESEDECNIQADDIDPDPRENPDDASVETEYVLLPVEDLVTEDVGTMSEDEGMVHDILKETSDEQPFLDGEVDGFHVGTGDIDAVVNPELEVTIQGEDEIDETLKDGSSSVEVEESVELQEQLIDDDPEAEEDIIELENFFVENEELPGDSESDSCADKLLEGNIEEEDLLPEEILDDSEENSHQEEVTELENVLNEEKLIEDSVCDTCRDEMQEVIELESILDGPETESSQEEVIDDGRFLEQEEPLDLQCELCEDKVSDDEVDREVLQEEEPLMHSDPSCEENVIGNEVQEEMFQEEELPLCGSEEVVDEELEQDIFQHYEQNDGQLPPDDLEQKVPSSTALNVQEKLQQLIAESRALAEASRNKSSRMGAESNPLTLSPDNTSVLERYYTTTLELRGPQGMRLASPTSPRRQVSPAPAPKEDYPPEDDEDASWDDASDDSTSSTSSYSSSSSSSEDDYHDGDIMRSVPVAVRNLDRSLHTILEESCEESESEQKTWPLPRGQQKSVDSADPSQLERYFHMAFGGERKRASWDGSETSDTTSETSSSIFSEATDFCEHEDDDDHDDDSVALASSRLEKYFLGFSGCPHPGMSSPVDEEGCATPRPDPSDESNDELGATAFEKNDGCDTIKRAKKHRGFSSDEEDPTQGTGPRSNVPNTGSAAATADKEGKDKETGATENDSGRVDDDGEKRSHNDDPSGTCASTLDVPAVAGTPSSNDQFQEVNAGPRPESKGENQEDVGFADAKVVLEPLPEAVPIGECVENEEEEEENDDDAERSRAVTVIGNFVGRALTMDRKQQSRDSGFIGSSDDLLREESSSSSGSSSIASELYTGTKEEHEERKVCVNVEEETRYIVTQLMSQMTKSMLRSPQLARAKPPEILAFENELTKLMQTVPGIDDTVKEIIEELSSTDYCSDSYESSDYTSSDPEGLFTPTPSSRHSRRLSAAVSGLAASPLASPTPSNRSLNKEPLSEDTMYIYQRFMMSLAKMAEHVSEEESAGGDSVPGTGSSEKGSPPPAVKAVQHVRDRLAFLMREVQGESTYPRRNFRRRPGSDAASLCSTNSTTSSATAAGVDGDSEGSPTDTETSVDSDDGCGDNPTVESSVASPVGTTVEGMELERWNSDATIVEHVSQTPSRAESVGGSAGSVFCPSSPNGSRSRRASESRSRSGAGSRAALRSAGRGGTLSASVDALEKPAQGKTEHRRPRSLLSSRGKAGSAFCLSAGSQEWKPHFGSCWQLRTACESPRQGGSLQQIWMEHPKDMCRSTPEDLPETPITQHPVPIQQQRIYQRSQRSVLLPAGGGRSGSQPPSRFHHGAAPLPQLGARSHSASHGSLCPKASTLPRGANDLHANVSFLHNSVSGLLTASNTNLVPPAFAAQPQTNRLSADAAEADGPACRREIRSWPDKTCSQSVDNVNTTAATPPQPSFRHIQRTAMSMSKGLAGGSSQELHVPSAFRDKAEDSPGCLRVNMGAGSAAGSSDREEEDIDRIVALHINRGSVSSLAVRSESMSSVYSAAGGGHYGAIAVRGEVQFGLSYNYMTGTLGVLVKQCRDLAAVNAKHNRSDPYVKVYLLPDKSKGGKRKTRVKRHSLNPTFDEQLKYPVTISELETRTLWLTVWHSDMFGRNEFLGEVTLPMGYVAFDDPLPKWYPLQERLGPPDEVFSYKGDLVIALKFMPPDVTNQKKGKSSRGALHVLVKEAHNLTATRSNGTSDPFCKSYLLPDKGKNSKQKTAVVKRNCSPKWNHTFVYNDVTTDELSERCLELTLWDYDRITSNDFLGGVRLSLGGGKYQGKDVEWMDSQADEITVWQDMLDRPNCWVDATVLLRPNMDPRQF